MLKRILLVLLVLIGALLAYATTRPDTFEVRRSVTIKAPADRIYPLISDFGPQGWRKWSPWEELDPSLERSYSGAPSGVGATYAWKGNDKAGAGRMEIVGATPPTGVDINLDFLKPFEAHNRARFTLTGAGDDTRVDWSMTGPNNYIAKVMQVFFDMDKLVGGDFERGLARLKALAEQ